MTPTQTQAALLSAHWYSIDKHGAATLCVDEDDAKATAIDSQTLYPHNGPYRAVQMAPIEPAQAGELPDEREAFEATVLKDNHHAVLTKRRNGCYQDDELQSMWWAWQARAALREKEQAK